MKYNFEIQFKRQYSPISIHTLRFESETSEIVDQFVEKYGKQDIEFFLKEFLSLFTQDSNPDTVTVTEKISQLSDDQLREKIKELLSEISHLKSAKQTLENRVSELSESKANKEVAQLQIQIKQLQRELNDVKSCSSQLSRDLSSEKTRNSQYRQSDTDYENLRRRWSELFPQFRTLEDLANNISSLQEENKKLKKSNQNLEKRVQEIEKELQEAQQKFSVATTRLRGLNINPNLAGGDSRSDKLRIDFKNLKSGLFYDASSKVLNGWIDRGSKLTFKSEESSQIKSILSERVFRGGMAYFAKDKAEIDAELHLIMGVLSDIEDFSLTPAISQKIQERIQAGLLSSKGVDNSDQALMKYVEEVTKLIDRDLQQIANFETTGEALAEIVKFAGSGLRLVRDIVNDPNSGELFMPENGAAFDESAHETRDEPRGQIKMTIYPGYRVAGNVLVKAEVITYDSDSKKKEFNPSPSSDSQNAEEESKQQNSEGRGDKAIENEAPRDSEDSPSQNVNQEESNLTDSQASSVQDIPQNADENQEPVEQKKPPVVTKIIFTGKVTPREGVCYRSKPHKDFRTDREAKFDFGLRFDGWTVVDSSEDNYKRWYKLAEEDYWVPANFIDGDPPSDLPAMTIEGGGDEPK